MYKIKIQKYFAFLIGGLAMLIEIISFIIIVVVIFIFAKLNYKKCEKEGEKIKFIFQ